MSVNAKKSGALELTGVTKNFGSTKALEGLDLKIEAGELVSLLGPSGCGKTTALRIVAGLEKPSAGSITIDGESINDLPASQRDMGMVFQSYSLFPNMTVEENIQYGLRVRKISSDKREKRCKKMLELVHLSNRAKSYPHQLSGGQQQRVALARALAIEPRVLLLDEPLSALDAQVRHQIREEIRAIQLNLGMTTLFVTHDQEEAMSISDRVGVMSNGKIEQISTPAKIYNSPKTPFVAKFVGMANKIPVQKMNGNFVRIFNQNIKISENAEKISHNDELLALIRPESIALASDKDENAIRAKVYLKSFLGPLTRLICNVEGYSDVHVNILSNEVRKLEVGDKVFLKLLDEEVMVEVV